METQFSFVIPAFNEEQHIATTLDAIREAMDSADRRVGYDIIVVDDGSTDSTAAIARRRPVHLLEVRKRNIAAVRNMGAREARGEFLVFVDADTQLSQSLADELIISALEGTTWGTALAIPSDSCPLWARVGLAVYNYFYVYWRKCAYGFFFFVNRQVFQESGGFPEETRDGEDMALSKLLARQYGRPTVLGTRVATSARKAQQLGFWYHMRMLWLTVRYGDEAYSRPEIADYRDGELRVRHTGRT